MHQYVPLDIEKSLPYTLFGSWTGNLYHTDEDSLTSGYIYVWQVLSITAATLSKKTYFAAAVASLCV